jgi:hypothetical protein
LALDEALDAANEEKVKSPIENADKIKFFMKLNITFIFQ